MRHRRADGRARRVLFAFLTTLTATALVPHSPAIAEDALSGPGYNLKYTAGLRPTGYTVRFIDSPNVEAFRTAWHEVAFQLHALDIPFAIAPGTIAKRDALIGEITFEVVPDGDCGPPQEGRDTLGCGKPLYVWGRHGGGPDPDKLYVAGGRTRVETPPTVGFSEAKKRHLIAHELGHALNLDHYDSSYGGKLQVLHSWDFAAQGTYQEGDRNGLAYQREYGKYTPPPPPPVDRRRIGIVDLNGNCHVNEGGVNSPGVVVRGPGCTQIALDGERIAVRESNGNCYVKEGNLDALWSLLRGPNCVKVGLDDQRIVVLDGDGSCHAKDGPTDALWVTIWATTCADFSLDGDRIAVRDTTNQCHVKQGGLGGLWTYMRGPGCLHIVVDGGRIATADADTNCYAKEGGLDAQWTLQRGPGCVAMAIDGTRIVAREAGSCYAKDGGLLDGWVLLYATFCERAALDGPRIAVRDNRFEDCYVKDGGLDGAWNYKGRCKDIVVSDGVT